MKAANTNTRVSKNAASVVAKENILSRKKLNSCLAAMALLVGLGTAAVAQSDALRKLYETSATIATNVEGIHALSGATGGLQRPDRVR